MAQAEGMLFGEIAVRENLISKAQVTQCLEIQEKLRSFGVVPKRIGEVLIEKGFTDDSGIAKVLEIQKHRQETFSIPGYDIMEMIGKGGMGGQVYKARQVSLDRVVALKVLPPRYAKDRTFRERFISEARAVARLNHENIIAGIDVGEVNGYCYFVMEFVEGETVAEVIERSGPFEEKRALQITHQITAALSHANRHNLVHRDVKPQNVLVAQNDVAKLCDLGLAKMTEASGEDSQETERRGIPIGTPHYISPEQARGELDVDIRSDVYSLGATLYHMLTGETPFVGSSPMVLMTKHLTEEPEAPSRRNQKVSRQASDLTLRMMAKERENRPQTPDDLTQEIEQAMSGRRAVPSSRRQRPTSARHAASSPPVARKRERPDAGLQQFIDPEAQARRERARRVRARRIHTAKSSESISLFVAVGMIIVLAILFLGSMFGEGIQIAPGPSDEDNKAAQEIVKHAASLRSEQRLDEARLEYERVIRDYPETKWAEMARDHLSRLR